MRKNNVKKKRKNIFELLGIKQDNKKWITLTITLLLMGYLIFCLTYAPISCIVNIKASAETENEYTNIYTTDNENRFIVELPTLYIAQYNRYVEATTTIKYVMNTNYEELILLDTRNGIDNYTRHIIAENYEENIEGTFIQTIDLYATKYDIYDQNEKVHHINYRLFRKQIGTINLTEIKYFNIMQDVEAPKPVGFKVIKDENNYIEYWLDSSTTMYMPYWDIQNTRDFELNKGLFVYKDRNEITSQLGKDYWQQYFTNNETFKDTYKDYWYEYYYQRIYNEGLRAGQTYSETSFYTLIDAITFGAIKPIYSILNFELLGVNLWNLATSIFTVLIIVIIIKFIGMVI